MGLLVCDLRFRNEDHIYKFNLFWQFLKVEIATSHHQYQTSSHIHTLHYLVLPHMPLHLEFSTRIFISIISRTHGSHINARTEIYLLWRILVFWQVRSVHWNSRYTVILGAQPIISYFILTEISLLPFKVNRN